MNESAEGASGVIVSLSKDSAVAIRLRVMIKTFSYSAFALARARQ